MASEELFRTHLHNTSQHPQPFHLELADIVKACEDFGEKVFEDLSASMWLARGGILACGNLDAS